MSLRDKITAGFFLSAIIMGILLLFGYLNFVEVRREIRFLELSDTIRSKTLQLRRHEKNYLLYRNPNELSAVYAYLNEINAILLEGVSSGRGSELQGLKSTVEKYGQTFNGIENIVWDFRSELNGIKRGQSQNLVFFQLIEAASLENPLLSADAIRKSYPPAESRALIKSLEDLDREIKALRELGEEMIAFSKEYDKTAREKADRAIYFSQAMMLFALPFFLLLGLGISLLISSGILKRLSILTKAVEKASEGKFTYVSGFTKNKGRDEVDILIQRFNYMEEQIEERERELLQSKKLAAIGTLASGVAHELNNPLSNIYTTAQRLKKKVGDGYPQFFTKGLDDIFEQSLRVKKIVGELLEFARGRDPQFRTIEVDELIRSAYSRISDAASAEGVAFLSESPMGKICASVDPEQMEQVFINLFRNAVEAMSGEGTLSVVVEPDYELNNLIIRISDTGKGMSRETVEKIFEPFFTTKDKGTGLGLAIVYNIVKKHGGDIQVRSEEGKGSAFVVTLPLEKG